jgi:hypothetical protein
VSVKTGVNPAALGELPIELIDEGAHKTVTLACAATALLLLVSTCTISRAGEEREDSLCRLLAEYPGPESPELVCRVHRVPTELREVRVVDGMCVQPPGKYIHALFSRFPAQSVAEERLWRQAHGWSVDQE